MARIKEILGPSMPHAWAHQTQEYGAYDSRRNFYFQGRTIYSYGSHFPIATIDDKDPHIVWFTLNTYGPTTAGHIQAVSGAVSHKEIIYVHKLIEDPCRDKAWQKREVESFLGDIKKVLPLLEKARKKQRYMDQIADIKKRLERFMTHLKIKPTKALDKALNDPSAQAVREYSIEQARKEQAANARKSKADLKKALVTLEYWRRNEALPGQERAVHSNAFRALSVQTGVTYLRVVGDSIETSKGIELPVVVAERYYHTIQRVLANKEKVGNCKIKFLDYCVESITSGGIVVGCHDIPTEEINNIAARFGWKVD